MQTWQQKLSSLKVAHFPWDPTPAPNHLQNTSTIDRKPPAHALQGNGTTINSSSSYDASTSARIKPDPGYAAPVSSQYQIPQMQGGGVAPMTPQERAARQLQSRYGDEASPQIRQLQQQAAAAARVNQTQQRSSGLQLPNYEAKIKHEPHPDFDPQRNQQPAIKTDQTDGPGEGLTIWKSDVERHRNFTANHPGEGDRLIHQHYLYSQNRLEGGGLMLPLDEKVSQTHGTKRKLAAAFAASEDSGVGPSVVGFSQPRTVGRAQLDGGDDEEDSKDLKDGILDDEDAINSDLDDPDELAEGAEDEDEAGQNMYCTYDKVQRVKNKWKCTMKDGILTAGGKE